jgi:dTDP-4-amino-4,6-dideoxygalactose transaminase
MYNIPLIKPYIDENIKKRVLDVLDSGYLTEGPVTAEFQNRIKEYTGCKHAIAVTSCTTGLEIALRALNIGPGDEVLVPDYTYPATADVVVIVGATPVVVDIDFSTMLIDYDALEKTITSKTKAVIPVSLFGNPLDYDRLDYIKNKYKIAIIEDAACAIGADYKGKKVGSSADITVFSLHPRKFITTGEGGIVTTEDDDLALWMDSYKHFGIGKAESREKTQFVMIGTNYKLSNVLAAIGLGQMDVIDELLGKRRELAENYLKLLGDVKGITIPVTTDHGLHSYQSFAIFVENRDLIMTKLRQKGIEVQIGTYSLHMHKAFENVCKGSYQNSRRAFEQCLVLPLYHTLTEQNQINIVTELKELI